MMLMLTGVDQNRFTTFDCLGKKKECYHPVTYAHKFVPSPEKSNKSTSKNFLKWITRNFNLCILYKKEGTRHKNTYSHSFLRLVHWMC